MADIHVLDMNRNELRVVFHIPVPDANNVAGVSYREALVHSGRAGKSVLLDAADPDNPRGWEIGANEKTALSSGAMLEHVEQIHVLPEDWADLSRLREKVFASYDAVKNAARERAQYGLRFWGLAQDR